ncbi:hypothetical protein [Brevibacillus sedimenti]|uniref:hypothetical protein n=1 Tax=Brevibacillus sedimenti TaxID=2613334 RepID=UPI001E4FD041|nr:hypothetical protein [Anoxybacillus sediminis]UFJ61310.1 hypothetical protein IRT44_19180 [Anoxybacillus sediminis]
MAGEQAAFLSTATFANLFSAGGADPSVPAGGTAACGKRCRENVPAISSRACSREAGGPSRCRISSAALVVNVTTMICGEGRLCPGSGGRSGLSSRASCRCPPCQDEKGAIRGRDSLLLAGMKRFVLLFPPGVGCAFSASAVCENSGGFGAGVTLLPPIVRCLGRRKEPTRTDSPSSSSTVAAFA